MPNIKEIALRISEKADKYADAKLQSKGEFHPDWHTVRDEYFAEALIAELAKGNEPVARLLHRETNSPQEAYRTVARTYEECEKDAYPDTWEEGKPLYTFPPTAEQIANETAEAIAEYCRNQDHYCLATEIESGAWKEFK